MLITSGSWRDPNSVTIQFVGIIISFLRPLKKWQLKLKFYWSTFHDDLFFLIIFKAKVYSMWENSKFWGLITIVSPRLTSGRLVAAHK